MSGGDAEEDGISETAAVGGARCGGDGEVVLVGGGEGGAAAIPLGRAVVVPEKDDGKDHDRHKIMKGYERHEVIEREHTDRNHNQCPGKFVALAPSEKTKQWIDATGDDQVCETLEVEWQDVTELTQQ